MNFFVHQNIVIHSLKVEAISNSSVLQIGSAGMIKPLSQLFNTGAFTEPAPPAAPIEGEVGVIPSPIPFIPLTPPTEP